jgi:hypothetical protein
MIFGTTGTQFSSRVCLSVVVYLRKRCQCQSLNWASWMIFWVNWDSVFNNGLYVRSSLFAQKMSASAVQLGFFDDFLGHRVLVSVHGF